MAKKKSKKYSKPLPIPGEKGWNRLKGGFKKLAKKFKLFGIDDEEAKETALDIQFATAMRQHGIWSKKQFKNFFYREIYDPLLEDYDLDMHSQEFREINSP